MKKRAPTISRSRNRTMSRSENRGASAFRRRGVTPKSSRRISRRTRGGASTRARAGQRRHSGKLTTDHEQIRRWVEERGGLPATVKRTIRDRQQAGILRIDFPGFSGAQTLVPISWDEWFDMFEQRRLAFLYQDRSASGKPSRFNKLVCRQ